MSALGSAVALSGVHRSGASVPILQRPRALRGGQSATTHNEDIWREKTLWLKIPAIRYTLAGVAPAAGARESLASELFRGAGLLAPGVWANMDHRTLCQVGTSTSGKGPSWADEDRGAPLCESGETAMSRLACPRSCGGERGRVRARITLESVSGGCLGSLFEGLPRACKTWALAINSHGNLKPGCAKRGASAHSRLRQRCPRRLSRDPLSPPKDRVTKLEFKRGIIDLNKHGGRATSVIVYSFDELLGAQKSLWLSGTPIGAIKRATGTWGVGICPTVLVVDEQVSCASRRASRLVLLRTERPEAHFFRRGLCHRVEIRAHRRCERRELSGRLHNKHACAGG